MNKSEMQKKYQMTALAEIYNQRPEDPMFKKFSPEAMKGIQRLAEALQKARKEGRIK